MKMYFITNMYLSPIQKGIQSAHALAEMYEKYSTIDKMAINRPILTDWAENHKTIIILNGGTNVMMLEKLEKIALYAKDIIYDIFKEPELNDTITCIALLEHNLPSDILDMLYSMSLA